MTQLEALALSLAVEVPVALAAARLGRLVPRARLRRLALCALAATLVTHPGAWAANGALVGVLPWPPRAAVIEAAVIVVEAALYGWLVPMGRPRALALSALANVASFLVGLAVIRAA